MSTDGGFLARWSRRKQQAAQGVATETAPPVQAPLPSPAPVAAAVPAPAPALDEPVPAPPAPTLADVAQLTPQSDFTRFAARDVAPEVRNAAMKKLFSDPHFNVMDGLDVYIDDYSRPDPLPLAMLRGLAQSQALGLFAAEPPAAPPVSPPLAAPAPTPPDEDPDLRLQPHDAAGAGPGEPSGPEPGGDAAGQC